MTMIGERTAVFYRNGGTSPSLCQAHGPKYSGGWLPALLLAARPLLSVDFLLQESDLDGLGIDGSFQRGDVVL